jgi:hypothetical protein
MGAIYGIPEPSEQQPIQLLAKLDAAGNQTAFLYIKKVFSDYCIVGFETAEEKRQLSEGSKDVAPPSFQKNKISGYKCLIKKLLNKPLKVAFIGKEWAKEWAAFSTKNASLLDLSSVIPVSTASEADYVLNTEGSIIFIAAPFAPTRPLVVQVFDKNSDTAFNQLLAQLQQISRWEFVKKHDNKTGGKDLLNKITIDKQGNHYTPKDGKIDFKFHYDKIEGTFYSKEEIAVKIINNSTDTLYVVSAWLGERFGIDCTYINENSLASPLEAGKSVSLWGDKTTPITFLPYIKKYNWDKISNILKVYVSDAPFNITLLQQTDLEPPTDLRDELKSVAQRPAEVVDKVEKTAQWAVQNMELVIYTGG